MERVVSLLLIFISVIYNVTFLSKDKSVLFSSNSFLKLISPVPRQSGQSPPFCRDQYKSWKRSAWGSDIKAVLNIRNRKELISSLHFLNWDFYFVIFISLIKWSIKTYSQGNQTNFYRGNSIKTGHYSIKEIGIDRYPVLGSFPCRVPDWPEIEHVLACGSSGFS